MSIRVEVWGDYACFSRPELKVERVSYDVMTPSAARGLLEAIYWHPGMRWRIDRLYVRAPIQFVNIRRNEVKDKISAHNVKTAMKTGKPLSLITSESIDQRATMALRDVRYVIEAHFDMTDQATPTDNPGKFQDIMKRRLEKGQNFHQPCLGVREFTAHYAPCQDIPPCPQQLLGERDLGYMLYDMDYTDPQNIRPQFFRAVMKDGVIDLADVEVRS